MEGSESGSLLTTRVWDTSHILSWAAKQGPSLLSHLEEEADY